MGASHRLPTVVNTILVAGLFGFILVQALRNSISNWNWPEVLAYRDSFIQGWIMTLQISGVTLVVSTALGLVLAFASRSRFLPLRQLSRTYIEIIRGCPLLVVLLIGYYGIADAVGLEDRYVAGVLILSMFSAAYISEIIRGGLEGVGEHLLESARAVGLSSCETFVHVTLPLATRAVLPALTGQLALLVKDSSLLSIIAVGELSMNARQVASVTLGNLESFILLAGGYLLITLPISFFARWLQEVLHYEA